jgi:hypothetical protein
VKILSKRVSDCVKRRSWRQIRRAKFTAQRGGMNYFSPRCVVLVLGGIPNDRLFKACKS